MTSPVSNASPKICPLNIVFLYQCICKYVLSDFETDFYIIMRTAHILSPDHLRSTPNKTTYHGLLLIGLRSLYMNATVGVVNSEKRVFVYYQLVNSRIKAGPLNTYPSLDRSDQTYVQ